MDQGIFRFHNWCSVFKVQVPCFQTVQKIVDVPQIEYEEQIVEVPVQKHVRVPMIQKVQKMVEVPQIEVEEKIVEVPVQSHVQVPMIQKVQKVVEAGFWISELSRRPNLLQTLMFWLDLGISAHFVKQPSFLDKKVPQVEIEEQVVEVPVTKHVQVPMIQTVQKSVDVPQIEYEDQAGGVKVS